MTLTRISLFFLVVVFGLGSWVRYANLDTHFTHVDDICIARTVLYEKQLRKESKTFRKELRANLKASSSISTNLTYAPFQFYITPWLINLNQDYREVLFWGRFPSFVFSVLASFGMLWFYQKFKNGKAFPYQILSLTLITCSWENIIYAQQMESYAIGVFSIIAMLIVMVHFVTKESFSMKEVILLSFILGALSYTQYQILFFIPAFYVTLFMAKWRSVADKKDVFKKITISVVLFGAMFFPVYFTFLRHHTNHGLNWNVGPEGQYVFNLNSIDSFLSKAVYCIQFFYTNFIEVFKIELAFMPLESAIYKWIAMAMIALFGIGIYSLVVAKDYRHKYLGIFFVVSFLSWVLLIVLQKITLSPTRHSLILLPLFIILITEGFVFLLDKIKGNYLKIVEPIVVSGLCSAGILFLFFYHYSEVVALRRDLFSPSGIEQILSNHKADLIVPYDHTLNVELMKNLRDKYALMYGEEWEDKFSHYKNRQTICLISARKPYPYTLFSSKLGFLDKNQNPITCDSSEADYFLVYKNEIIVDEEVDFGNKTRNGTNSFYLYVFNKK